MCCQPAQAWGRQVTPSPVAWCAPAPGSPSPGCWLVHQAAGKRRFSSRTVQTFCGASSTHTHARLFFFFKFHFAPMGQIMAISASPVPGAGSAGTSPATSECWETRGSLEGHDLSPHTCQAKNQKGFAPGQTPHVHLRLNTRGEAEGQEDAEHPESVSKLCCKPTLRNELRAHPHRAEQKPSLATPCWSLLGGLAPAQTPLPVPPWATGPSLDTH